MQQIGFTGPREINHATMSQLGDQQPKPVVATAQMLDVKQVALLLRCSARHVYRLVDGGKMPSPLRLGALVRWRQTDLEDWLAAGCPAVVRQKGGVR